MEASWPVAAVVWAAERADPRRYARAAFHVISNSTRDDLVARGIPAERIEVIYPGIDAAWYCPDPGDAACHAAYVPVRRPPEALQRSGYRVAGASVGSRARGRRGARHRGDGGRPAGGSKRQARQLGLEGAVRFLGFVSEEEKRRLLRSAWAVVLPSPKEGWGISNVEAAACGTPALASDSPGLRESVRHGETGFLVPHGDVGAAGAPHAASWPASRRWWRGSAPRRGPSPLPLTWERAAERTAAHLERVIASRR